ncbi:MAG: exodeoxyribonuclease V subunit alpha, partial [Microbacterium sp.]
MLEAGLGRIFPAAGFDEQRTAARSAVQRWTTIITGGPGTGKTTTVAGVLALIAEQHEHATGERPRIALAAPTGKAAARLQAAAREAVATFGAEDKVRLGTIRAVTVHSLLGSRMPRTSVRFKHHRHHRLPYDVVVVDEGSMLSLSMAARLLEALRPGTRLILVGDADQLSSVDAGAVLSDLVKGLEEHDQAPVTRLVTTHRYGGGIGALAAALRGPGPDADPAEVADAVVKVLAAGSADVVWVKPDDEDAMASFRTDVRARAAALLTAARQGSAADALVALDDHRLLCAHREGPFGVTGWNREIERMLADGGEKYVYQEWYAGRPVLVSANDRLLGLNNGDMGITVFGDQGRLQVALPTEDGEQFLSTTRMPTVQT